MPQKSRCKYDKIVQPELIMEEGLMHVVIPWVIRRCHLSSAPTRDYVAECLDNVIKGIDAQGNKHVKDPVFSQIQKEIKCYLKVMKLNSIEINYDDSDEDDNDGKVQFNNCCYNGKDTMSDEDEDSIEYTPRGVWCKGEIVFAKYSSWGWWPCKIVDGRVEKNKLEYEILFFEGYLHSNGKAVEHMSEWVASEDVLPFIESFHEIVSGKPTSSSIFDYFFHDLQKALKSVVTSIDKWKTLIDKQAIGLNNTYELLPDEPKRERWNGFVERYHRFFTNWLNTIKSIENKKFQTIVESKYLAIENARLLKEEEKRKLEEEELAKIRQIEQAELRRLKRIEQEELSKKRKLEEEELSRKRKLEEEELSERRKLEEEELSKKRKLEEIELKKQEEKRREDALSEEEKWYLLNTSRPGGGELREGTKVEVRYRGKARYYPGFIKRVNRDGTYDIDYDDGEKEMFVGAGLIRSLETARATIDCEQIQFVVYQKEEALYELLTKKKRVVPSYLACLIAIELPNREKIVSMYLEQFPNLIDEVTKKDILPFSRTKDVGERWTLLHHAACVGRAKVMDVIMKTAGVQINEDSFDSDGELIIYEGSSDSEEEEDCIGLIIRNEEDWTRKSLAVVNRGDAAGITPLIVAAIHGNSECLSNLIFYGASIQQRCKLKYTVLHWLCDENESFGRGHVECANVLTRNDETLVHAVDDRGLTALVWANAEQHVGLTKLLLDRGAVWSDANLEAMIKDVSLGHERRPIRIDLTDVGGIEGEQGKALMSRLRRFVYVQDCVSAIDEFSKQNVKLFTDIRGSKVKYCDCSNCFDNVKTCACVNKNGQRLPYNPIYNGQGEIVGIQLEPGLGITRTRIHECSHACVFYPNIYNIQKSLYAHVMNKKNTKVKLCVETSEPSSLSAACPVKSDQPINPLSKRRNAYSAAATMSTQNKAGLNKMEVNVPLTKGERQKLLDEQYFQTICCQNLNFCQQGVGVLLCMKGYPGKGFGVITEENLVKGQFVCTYDAEILNEEEGTQRETFWSKLKNASLGDQASLPSQFKKKTSKKSNISSGGSSIPSKKSNVTDVDSEEPGKGVPLDKATAVPGAEMKEVTFQVYLDKTDGSKVFDGTIFANVARFMNHSCDPNLKCIKIECGRAYPLLGFFCTRNIEKGEELNWNYDNSGRKKNNDGGIVCLCGATNCRGYI